VQRTSLLDYDQQAIPEINRISEELYKWTGTGTGSKRLKKHRGRDENCFHGIKLRHTLAISLIAGIITFIVLICFVPDELQPSWTW